MLRHGAAQCAAIAAACRLACSGVRVPSADREPIAPRCPHHPRLSASPGRRQSGSRPQFNRPSPRLQREQPWASPSCLATSWASKPTASRRCPLRLLAPRRAVWPPHTTCWPWEPGARMRRCDGRRSRWRMPLPRPAAAATAAACSCAAACCWHHQPLPPGLAGVAPDGDRPGGGAGRRRDRGAPHAQAPGLVPAQRARGGGRGAPGSGCDALQLQNPGRMPAVA